MIDPQLFRSNLESVTERLKLRGVDFDAAAYLALEQRRKDVQLATEALQQERNQRSKGIGQAKSQGQDIAPLLAQVGELGSQLKQKETELGEIQEQMHSLQSGLPNLAQDDVPVGGGEEDNVEISGKALSFGENQPAQGATIEVYRLNPGTGERLSQKPDAIYDVNANGNWGPLQVIPNTPYEYH